MVRVRVRVNPNPNPNPNQGAQTEGGAAASALRVTPDVSPPPAAVPAAASGVERIVFLGQSAPRRARARVGAGAQPVELETQHDAAARTLLVRKPPVRVGEAFTIELLG